MGTILLTVADIAGFLKQIPPTAWAAAIGSTAGALLALPGLVLSLRHARKLQARQLAHDSTERTRERQMAWRRQVYLEAAESTSRLSNLLGRMADLTVSDADLGRGYLDDFAKISRIQVIANTQTLSRINEYLGAFGSAYARLGTERGILVAQRNQIDSFAKQLQVNTEGKERCEMLLLQYGQNMDGNLRSEIATRMEVHRRQAEYCSQEKQRLMDEVPRAQQALLKASMDAGFQVSSLLLPALLAAREELEIPLDGDQYKGQSAEMTTLLRDSVTAALGRIDKVIADEDARQGRTRK